MYNRLTWKKSDRKRGYTGYMMK